MSRTGPDYAEAVRRVVDSAPPLADNQARDIARIMRAGNRIRPDGDQADSKQTMIGGGLDDIVTGPAHNSAAVAQCT